MTTTDYEPIVGVEGYRSDQRQVTWHCIGADLFEITFIDATGEYAAIVKDNDKIDAMGLAWMDTGRLPDCFIPFAEGGDDASD